MDSEKYNGVPFDQADELPEEEGNKTLHQLLADFRDGKITAQQYQNSVAEEIAREEVNED